jgi:pantothenate kinase
LKVGQIKALQETLLAKDAADINKACGTNFSVKFDWAAAPNADLEHYSASGYCDSALSAVRGICDDVAGSDAVKQKIKRITCGFGAKRTIVLKNGALDYKINFGSFKDYDFVIECLRNNL